MRPPTSVISILDWVWVDNNHKWWFYIALKQLPIRFFDYEQWSGKNSWQLVSFPKNHQSLIRRKIRSELGFYLPELEKLLWVDTQLLQFFNPKESSLSPDVSSYEANLLDGDVNGEYDLLDMCLVFQIPWKNDEEEYSLEVNISPTEVDSQEQLCIWDMGVKLSRVDHEKGVISDEYELELQEDMDIFKLLRKPIQELVPDFIKNSWHKRFESTTREDIEENKTKNHYQLPCIQTKFSKLMNQILSWEIEITDEVKEKAYKLLSS